MDLDVSDLNDCIADALAATRPGPALEAIDAARMALAELQREAVWLLYDADPNYARIGAVLGISRQAARKTYGPDIERRLAARWKSAREPVG
jgi:DNA-directed RNA polymerase specialized sigma24 family protein